VLILKLKPRPTVAKFLLPSVRALMLKQRALMEEDLRSPCTEEIAVFRAFAKNS